MTKFERIVKFMPAFDKRDPDPKKSYGFHGVELRMVLKGPKGAVQFVLFTNWQLPHITKQQEGRFYGKIFAHQQITAMEKAREEFQNVVMKEGAPEPIQKLIDDINMISAHTEQKHVSNLEDISLELRCFWMPQPADLGYHSYVPLHEGQTPMGSVRYDTKKSVEAYESLPESASSEERLMALLPERIETGTFTPCEYLDGAACYYDGSGLNADRIYKVLLEEGSDGVWKELEEYYENTFRDVAEPIMAKGV